MSVRWHVSVFDRETERLLFDRALTDVSDEDVRAAFDAAPGAIGGFEATEHHLAFLKRHAGASVDLGHQVAFVELVDETESATSDPDRLHDLTS